MEKQLLEAYLNTDYKVFNPSITIKIGEHNADLDNLLETYNVSEWAYITPYNPFSKILSDEENNLRFEELKNKLATYIFFAGEGVELDSSWKPERSFLIIGIIKDTAMKIGKEYEQNAIVYGTAHHAAEIIILNDI